MRTETILMVGIVLWKLVFHRNAPYSITCLCDDVVFTQYRKTEGSIKLSKGRALYLFIEYLKFFKHGI